MNGILGASDCSDSSLCDSSASSLIVYLVPWYIEMDLRFLGGLSVLVDLPGSSEL